jgi:hypothetical protein
MMAIESKNAELKGYAGDWITERTGTEIPFFLKLAFPIIGISCMIYLIVYMNGELASDHGALVQQLNAVTGTFDIFMYIVTGMIGIFLIILVMFLFGKTQHED